jgi:hypothetical protein
VLKDVRQALGFADDDTDKETIQPDDVVVLTYNHAAGGYEISPNGHFKESQIAEGGTL